MAKVFMSYRREDTASVAGRMYDRLVAYFGVESVFKDVDSIPAGANFMTALQDALRQCPAALVFIDPGWQCAPTADGQRRIDDAHDWVRVEIEQVLALGRPVIPILLGGATMPAEADLPESLRDLAQFQALEVRNDPDFSRDMERVMVALELAGVSTSLQRGSGLLSSLTHWTHPPQSQRITGSMRVQTLARPGGRFRGLLSRSLLWSLPFVVIALIAILLLTNLNSRGSGLLDSR